MVINNPVVLTQLTRDNENRGETFNLKGNGLMFIPFYSVLEDTTDLESPVSEKILTVLDNAIVYLHSAWRNKEVSIEYPDVSYFKTVITSTLNGYQERTLDYIQQDTTFAEHVLAADYGTKRDLGLPTSKLNNNKQLEFLRTFEKIKSNLTPDEDDILVSNEKPYSIVIRSNMIYVVMYPGFYNLLYKDTNLFKQTLLSELVYESQNAYGSEQLFNSSLFGVYMLNLDKSTLAKCK